jgi:hypothetical protein
LKTKCIAWLQVPRSLPKLQLCGNDLPWVDRIVHLGNTVTNQKNIMETDMKIKIAKYVSKNIEINQEFSFASEETKLKVSDIYNSSWFGSVLWDLFCPSAVKLESSWNRNVKITMDLPFATHTGLIEPLSGRKHLKRILLKRFMMMISSIEKSKKLLLKTILKVSKYNTNSTTGRKLRNIMILAGKHTVTEVEAEDLNSFPYFPRPGEEEWRLEMLQHLLEERKDVGLDESDLEWLEFLCIK